MKKKTSRPAQGAGAAEDKGQLNAIKTPNMFSLNIEKSIIMPQNYRGDGIHIGATEDGLFNPNSEDICLLVQIKDNIFRATIGDKTMYCILLTDEQAKRIEQSVAHVEAYELASELRDTQNVFVYRSKLNDLLAMFSLGYEDCKFLYKVHLTKDSQTGVSDFNLSGDIEMQIDRYELWNILEKYGLDMASKGDSDSIEALATNLTTLNKLNNEVLGYLLFLKGVAKETKGYTAEAAEIYAEVIKLDPSMEEYIKQMREQQTEQL